MFFTLSRQDNNKFDKFCEISITFTYIQLHFALGNYNVWRKKLSMKNAKYFSDIGANHENTTALNVFYVILSG